jgi:hypothetical protein
MTPLAPMPGAWVQFDDVKPGDRLHFLRTYRGFVGGGETLRHVGTVERVTAQTVFLSGGKRLTRRMWSAAEPHRVDGWP